MLEQIFIKSFENFLNENDEINDLNSTELTCVDISGKKYILLKTRYKNIAIPFSYNIFENNSYSVRVDFEYFLVATKSNSKDIILNDSKVTVIKKRIKNTNSIDLLEAMCVYINTKGNQLHYDKISEYEDLCNNYIKNNTFVDIRSLVSSSISDEEGEYLHDISISDNGLYQSIINKKMEKMKTYISTVSKLINFDIRYQ